MSYCRFSSDNFGCDVYVYHSVGDFWVVHVAGCRYKGVKNLPVAPQMSDYPEDKDEWIAAFMAHNTMITQFVENAERIQIGLPHDGKTYQFGEPGTCAEFLKELQGLGYDVPDYAISALIEDQEDLDNAAE